MQPILQEFKISTNSTQTEQRVKRLRCFKKRRPYPVTLKMKVENLQTAGDIQISAEKRIFNLKKE